MNAARVSLQHAALPLLYWEDAVHDAAYKYNFLKHRSTGHSPHELWYKTKLNPTPLFTFGQLGTVPIHAPKSKIQAISMPVRYSFRISDTLNRVRHVRNRTYHTVRATDFAPYDKLKDPTYLQH